MLIPFIAGYISGKFILKPKSESVNGLEPLKADKKAYSKSYGKKMPLWIINLTDEPVSFMDKSVNGLNGKPKRDEKKIGLMINDIIGIAKRAAILENKPFDGGGLFFKLAFMDEKNLQKLHKQLIK